MFLIVGLGNPEGEYSMTRHNMGFDVINQLAASQNISVQKKKFRSLYGQGNIAEEKVILLKPQTYMNLSGEAVKDFKNFYKIKDDHIIIIYDDMDIEPGLIKIRKQGGPGTHNGMKSVVHELQTEEFPRIRIGVGTPQYKEEILHYIIAKMSMTEYEALRKPIETASQAIIDIITKGIDHAMNQYN